MLARATSVEARPVQVRQVQRLLPVACLGLVGATFMWLACLAKPGTAAQLARWMEGECEVYSGAVRQESQVYADYFLVRLEARFFHQHADVRLPSASEVNANGACAFERLSFALATAGCDGSCIKHDS